MAASPHAPRYRKVAAHRIKTGTVRVGHTPASDAAMLAAWVRGRPLTGQVEAIATAVEPHLGVRLSYDAIRHRLAQLNGGRHLRVPVYTEQQLADIEVNYGLEGAASIAARFNAKRGKVIGHTYTPQGIEMEARRLGCRSKGTGLMPAKDLAERLGVPSTTLRSAALRNRIRWQKGTQAIFFTPEQVEALTAYFAPPPWPFYTAKQAADLLGYTVKQFRARFIRYNRVAFVRHGKTRLSVRKADVDRLKAAQDLRAQGAAAKRAG